MTDLKKKDGRRAKRNSDAALIRESTGDKVELRSDGFERFRKAVHAAAKSGPKHRKSKD